MTPHELIASASAQRAVLFHLAAAHDRWSELEQAEAHAGHVHLQESAHQMALLVLRAWLAEKDDPEPAA